jgi:hypothetical protein
LLLTFAATFAPVHGVVRAAVFAFAGADVGHQPDSPDARQPALSVASRLEST